MTSVSDSFLGSLNSSLQWISVLSMLLALVSGVGLIFVGREIGNRQDLKVEDARYEADRAKQKADEFGGGHLTPEQKHRLILMWQLIADKSPIWIKRPDDYRKGGWLGFHLEEVLREAECKYESEIIKLPSSNSAVVFICSKTTSEYVSGIEEGLRENDIDCKVIVDGTFIHEGILLAIGCRPEDVPRLDASQTSCSSPRSQEPAK